MKTIAIDVDGTIAAQDGDFDSDFVEAPLPGAVAALQELAKTCKIILHSCRTTPGFGEDPRAAQVVMAMWADEHGIPYDDIWTERGKPHADLYLDNKGMKFDGDWSVTLQRVKEALYGDTRSVADRIGHSSGACTAGGLPGPEGLASIDTDADQSDQNRESVDYTF